MGEDVVQRSRALRDGRRRRSRLDQRRKGSKRNFILKASDASRASAADGLSYLRKDRRFAICHHAAALQRLGPFPYIRARLSSREYPSDSLLLKGLCYSWLEQPWLLRKQA